MHLFLNINQIQIKNLLNNHVAYVHVQLRMVEKQLIHQYQKVDVKQYMISIYQIHVPKHLRGEVNPKKQIRD